MAEFNPRDFRRGLRHVALTDAEYRVAVELADFSMIGKPVVWPSLPLLAENCCMADRRSVRRILGRLETKGVIVCIARSKGGRSQTSHWRLCMPETGTGGSPFTDHKTGTQTAQNRDPGCHKTGTGGSPEVVIEEERSSGARAPAPANAAARAPHQGSGQTPINDEDAEHPETWEEWAAGEDVPVERPECKRHPNGDTGQPCGGCREARTLLTKWQEERQGWREAQQRIRDETNACRFCNDLGQYTHDGDLWCEHQLPPPGYIPTGTENCSHCLDSGYVISHAKWNGKAMADCHPDDPEAKRLIGACECKQAQRRKARPNPPIPEEPPPKTCTEHPDWNGPPCVRCQSDKRAHQTWLADSRRLLNDLERQRDRATGTDAAAISDERRQRIAVFQRLGENWK